MKGPSLLSTDHGTGPFPSRAATTSSSFRGGTAPPEGEWEVFADGFPAPNPSEPKRRAAPADGPASVRMVPSTSPTTWADASGKSATPGTDNTVDIPVHSPKNGIPLQLVTTRSRCRVSCTRETESDRVATLPGSARRPHGRHRLNRGLPHTEPVQTRSRAHQPLSPGPCP
ncbi:MAG: hypothetical protein CM1200mP36_02270 [Gammaproteobacteria bacterium]|nr:MAG: hypothetical protein CM1200mP36_02270 [Gammaproteobacteria bacterium]